MIPPNYVPVQFFDPNGIMYVRPSQTVLKPELLARMQRSQLQAKVRKKNKKKRKISHMIFLFLCRNLHRPFHITMKRPLDWLDIWSFGTIL